MKFLWDVLRLMRFSKQTYDSVLGRLTSSVCLTSHSSKQAPLLLGGSRQQQQQLAVIQAAGIR